MWECEWEKGRVEDDPEQYFIIFIISLLYPAMENGACGAHNHNSDVAARGTRRVTTIKTLPSHGIVRIAQGPVCEKHNKYQPHFKQTSGSWFTGNTDSVHGRESLYVLGCHIR